MDRDTQLIFESMYKFSQKKVENYVITTIGKRAEEIMSEGSLEGDLSAVMEFLTLTGAEDIEELIKYDSKITQNFRWEAINYFWDNKGKMNGDNIAKRYENLKAGISKIKDQKDQQTGSDMLNI